MKNVVWKTGTIQNKCCKSLHFFELTVFVISVLIYLFLAVYKYWNLEIKLNRKVFEKWSFVSFY